MKTTWIEHQVVDMDETMVQHCIVCGEVINDYRNAMWPIDQGPPTGYSTGSVYISGKNPTVFVTTRPNRIEDVIQKCNM